MAKPSVNILVNESANDVVCSNPAGDSNFVLLGAGDKIAWRDDDQVNGDSLTGNSYPVVIPESGSNEADKTFLMDYSSQTYRQIGLAGTTAGGQSGGNTQYVFAAYFGGATVTVPYLEAYDNNNHTTWGKQALGGGVAANSLFKAIATTNGAPGSTTWTGTPLAGTDSRIALDTGALGGAKFLYWNMKMLVPYTAANWTAAQRSDTDIVFAIHFTYS